MFVIMALIVGCLGVIPLLFSGKQHRIMFAAVAAVMYFIIGWCVFYANMPSLSYPLFGWGGGLAFIFMIVSALITYQMADLATPFSHRIMQNKTPFIIVAVIFVAYLGISVSGWEFFRAKEYAALIGDIKVKKEKHWNQDIQPVDPTHIRLVPKELAINKAKNVVLNGSQYELDTVCATLQKIKNDYFWLIPLDFKSYKVWTSIDYINQYVRVNASDPQAQAELITGKKMKYTRNAWFYDNMERRLYKKYYNYILTDFSFESDDNGNVYYVITACKPSIAFGGWKVEGIVLYDPETGIDRFETPQQADAWIDRIQPTYVIYSYISYFGELRDGWFNKFWNRKNIYVPETPTLNYSKDGRCVIATPVTSTSEQDRTMLGLVYTDSRTGESTIYYTTGGATEEDIVDQVNNGISNFKTWYASNQIVYENIYGQLSAIVPVLGGTNGTYQALAIVNVDKKTTVVEKNPQNAFINYQRTLMVKGAEFTTESVRNTMAYKGVIDRIGWDISGGEKRYYVLTKEKRVFLVSSQVAAELPLSSPGDSIWVEYISSEESAMPALTFINRSLAIKPSKNELKVLNQEKAEKK